MNFRIPTQPYPGVVPYGFRSSFRDWCGETGQPREVAEQALALPVPHKCSLGFVILVM